MDGNDGDEVSRDEVPMSEVPMSEILRELELPPDARRRWWNHLDAFFARHGGPRRYGALASLIAEARAAEPPPAPRGERG